MPKFIHALVLSENKVNDALLTDFIFFFSVDRQIDEVLIANLHVFIQWNE